MNNDVTPPTNKKSESPAPEDKSEDEKLNTDTNETSSPVVTSDDPTPADFGNKPGWGRRLLFAVVVLALLGGAVWAATRLSAPAKPTVSTVVKKDVPVLNIGIQEPVPEVMYPGYDDNTLDFDIGGQIFEGLTKFQDKTRVVPSLATSWSNPDSSTWLFKLRTGVKFHDGHAFDAQAVKDCFDDSKKYDILSLYNDTLKSVDVVNASTVKITTNGPDPLLLNKLTFLWVYDTKGSSPTDSANGTGPYTLKTGTKITADNIQLTTFDGYYGSKPKVHELSFTHFNDDKAITDALKQHKVDMGLVNDASLLKQFNAGYKSYTPQGLQVALLVPNTLRSGSPLANKTVRQAIYTALDPAALMKSRGIEGKPATQLVPESVPGYDPSIKRPATDVAKAKALLAQAGYPNGVTLKFSYYVNSKNLALEIQKELAAAGVTLTLDEQTSGKSMQEIAYGGKTDLYYIAYNTDLIDLSDVYGGMVLQQKNYSNPALEKLNSEAATTLDQAKRLKLLQQIDNGLMADYGMFPLYEPNSRTWIATDNLHLAQQIFNGYSGLRFSEVYAE